jgi:hypothetical protein
LKNARRYLAVLAALGCISLGGTLSKPQNLEIKPSPPLQNLKAFLPQKNELKNWKGEKASRLYKGEDLFLYIDGGAEIYHEYGFKQVLVQDYKSADGKSLTLEIFELANSECAFGIFTFKSSGKGRTIAVGQDGQLEDYYLNFWKGNILVTLTGFDGSPQVIQGLLLIANSVDAKIKTRGTRPSLVGAFPKEWSAASRPKYLKGYLGLYNNHQFFSRDVFRFKEGLTGNGPPGSKIFLLAYFTAEECQKRFREVETAFKQDQNYKDFKRRDARFFQVHDEKGNVLLAKLMGRYLAIVLASRELRNAEELLIRLEKIILSSGLDKKDEAG